MTKQNNGSIKQNVTKNITKVALKYESLSYFTSMSCFSLFYSTELFQYRNFLIFDIKKVFLCPCHLSVFFLRNNNNTHICGEVWRAYPCPVALQEFLSGPVHPAFRFPLAVKGSHSDSEVLLLLLI